MNPSEPIILGPEEIAQRILVLRGQRVLLDADLARIYGVPTKRLNEHVKRNARRFPEDFVFQLTPQEAGASIPQRTGRKMRPVPNAIGIRDFCPTPSPNTERSKRPTS